MTDMPAQQVIRSSPQNATPQRAPGTLGSDPWIWAALLVGILVRAWAFGSAPPGLHQDEASAGYDAYSLWHYGVDRNGFHNPVALVGWGSGMFALVAYAAMPSIALLGLTPVAVRLPCLVVGVLGLVLFAWLVNKLDGRRTARLATFLLAICPWHIVISRWALDSNLLPFVFLAGVAAAVWSFERPWCLPVAFAFLGLSLYAYGTAYIAVPVFVVGAVAYATYHGRWRPAPLLAGVAALALVSLPALLYVIVNWLKWDSIVTPWLSIPRLPGVPRFETVGNFHVWEPAFFARLASNLAGAAKIMVLQSDGQIWNAVPWFGLIYVFSLPLAALGLFRLCRDCATREFRPQYLLLAWCVATVVVAALVRPNINRLNIGLIPLVYCTALGVTALGEWRRWAGQGLVALYACSFIAFTATYFTTYQTQVAKAFYPSLTEAIRSASADPRGKVCVTHQVMFPYIFALFAECQDPREFIHTVEYSNPGEEFQLVSSYGRYVFGLPHVEDPDIRAFVVLPTDAFFSPDAYTTEKFGGFDVVRPR